MTAWYVDNQRQKVTLTSVFSLVNGRRQASSDVYRLTDTPYVKTVLFCANGSSVTTTAYDAAVAENSASALPSENVIPSPSGDIPADAIEEVNVVAASGAAQTIPDPLDASISRITLTANCTMTFPTPVAGKSFVIELTQDATGGRTVTWPAGTRWAYGTAPVLSGATKRDVISFICFNGANWAGFVSGQDVR